MFSVIVPIYKVEKYLSQCIESILNQSYKDFELILVDDGSPDGCSSICDEYKTRDNRVKVVHKKNGGLVSARKAGLKIAQGEYICFVDGDDFVSHDMLETYGKEFCIHKVDVICTGYTSYYNENTVTEIYQPGSSKIYGKSELQKEIYVKMLSKEPFYSFYIIPTVWSKCFKRSIAETVYESVPDDITLGEDVAVTYPILLEANSISILNYTGYMYRQNMNSMTHTYDKNLLKRIHNLIAYLKLIEKKTGWESSNQINEYAVYLLFLAKNNEFSFNNGDSYKAKKKNMNRYLCDSTFQEALHKVKLTGMRNKFIMFCFKSRWTLPLYLWDKIKSIGRKNE